jgi:ribonuclease E
VHATRKEDRRLSAALLAAALAHTPEAEEALRGARTRMARKPAALARELLRNFPKARRSSSSKRRRRKGAGAGPTTPPPVTEAVGTDPDDDLDDNVEQLPRDDDSEGAEEAA